MAVPSFKTPRIVNADKPGLVTDPGTLVFNNDTNRMEYVNLSASFIPFAGPNTIQQQLWVNDASGSDTNDGGEYTPFKTYDAARALAAATASPSNRFLIRIIGDLTLAGNFNINPYIDVLFEDSLVTIGGQILLDASFTVSNEIVYLTGFKPICAGGMNLTWTAGLGNWTIFINPSFSQCGASTIYDPSGANGFSIFNDVSPTRSSFPSGLTIRQVSSRMQSVNFGQSVTYDLLDNGLSLQHYLYDSSVQNSVLFTKTGGTSTSLGFVKNVFTGTQVAVQDAGWFLFIDPNSYAAVNVSGGATHAGNVFISNSTDGLTTGAFTPSYYPFVAGNYPTSALTGYLVGLDTVLPNESGSATLVGGTVTVLSTLVAAGDFIGLSCTASGGVPGFPVITINPGVSFTITSTSALDTSTFKWKNFRG